jgi:hypothetical protein
MSSQSYNTSTYDSFGPFADKTGISPGCPLRNSSDYVRMLRERSVYRESKSATDQPSVLLSQSNNYNVSYAMGRVECAGCTLGTLLTNRKLGS